MRTKATTRACGYCGYDLAGTAADLCPECGRRPSDWDFLGDRRLRWLRRMHLVAAGVPLLWVVVENAAYVAARVTLGSWPYGGNHPGATLPLEILVSLMVLAALVGLLVPPVLWFLIARRVGRLTPSGSAASAVLLRMMVVCVLAWGATVGLVWWDPIGAVDWAID